MTLGNPGGRRHPRSRRLSRSRAGSTTTRSGGTTNATDWAYTATWAPQLRRPPDVHARFIDTRGTSSRALNHWVEGWIDWNIVLDQRGGPNHVGNFCGAPIMIDVESPGYVYYTPVFHVLAQLSRTIRPGRPCGRSRDGASMSSAKTRFMPRRLQREAKMGSSPMQVLNTTKQPLEFSLEVGDPGLRR